MLVSLAGAAALLLMWRTHGRTSGAAPTPHPAAGLLQVQSRGGERYVRLPPLSTLGASHWGAVDDSLLLAVTAECSLQEERYIWYDPTTRIVVSTASAAAFHRGGSGGSGSGAETGAAAAGAGAGAQTNHTPAAASSHSCPLADIMLGAEGRSAGLCADAAVYVALLGARILPGDADLDAYTAVCGNATARMSLEHIHERWALGGGPVDSADGGSGGDSGSGGGSTGDPAAARRPWLAAWAPNFENAYASDAAAHAAMALVLCKVERCQELMAPYLSGLGTGAQLMLTGHTSLDPAAVAALAARDRSGGSNVAWPLARPPPQQQEQQPAPAAQSAPDMSTSPDVNRLLAGPDYNRFLHVRGKSSLKHTHQLLDCWARHPEWPTLTVVGPLPNPQVSISDARRFMAAPNIQVPYPGKPNGACLWARRGLPPRRGWLGACRGAGAPGGRSW